MELNWSWHAFLIFIVGTFIFRIGGRKSISQMTISQTIVMIGLGSLLGQPVAGKGLIITFLAALILTLLMVISESNPLVSQNQNNNIFEEIITKKFEGNKDEP